MKRMCRPRAVPRRRAPDRNLTEIRQGIRPGKRITGFFNHSLRPCAGLVDAKLVAIPRGSCTTDLCVRELANYASFNFSMHIISYRDYYENAWPECNAMFGNSFYVATDFTWSRNK